MQRKSGGTGASVLPGLERRLRRELTGDVLFNRFDRGRYATDASFYQIVPLGVVVPRTVEEALAAIAIAREEGVTVLPRGGGTSQCGQTVNASLVLDTSKHLNRILDLDVEGRTCVVEPGIVLDELNRKLKPHGLWFPVDVSTASRATIGGMAGNNSCGGRSLRYGTMRDNTLSMEAALAGGALLRFGPVSRDPARLNVDAPGRDLFRDLLTLGEIADERRDCRSRRRERFDGTEVDQHAVRQPRLDAEHVVHHVAVRDRARAARVVAGHAADGRLRARRHVDREPEAFRP